VSPIFRHFQDVTHSSGKRLIHWTGNRKLASLINDLGYPNSRAGLQRARRSQLEVATKFVRMRRMTGRHLPDFAEHDLRQGLIIAPDQIVCAIERIRADRGAEVNLRQYNISL
jgi:hypothetical protein